MTTFTSAQVKLACIHGVLFAVSTVTIAAPVAPTSALCVKARCVYRGVEIGSVSSRPVSEYIEEVRKNPRRKAAMDRVKAKIAARLTSDMGGSSIVSLRMAKGLTQSDIARETGLKQSYISRIENHRHTISDKNIGKIASALGVSEAETRAAFNVQWDYIGNHQA